MKIKYFSGKTGKHIQKAVIKVQKNEIVKRIFEKDYTVWKESPEYSGMIKNRLGWLMLPQIFMDNCNEIVSFAKEIVNEGFEYAVVLGMGGSSMCPEVLRDTFGNRKNHLKLFVLDSTDPAAIRETEKSIKLSKTLFIVSSKSGGTIEVDSFFRYFFDKMNNAVPENPGSRFIAITDPSTSLEERAREYNFRKIFINPPDIGGRYSALSYFGLVPAALIGIDIKKLLSEAETVLKNCTSAESKKNEGIRLGMSVGEFAKAGKDKLTFILSKDINSFGYWVEQLVAESTGKEGKGILPVEGESFDNVKSYGKDRVFINIHTKKNKKQFAKITDKLVKMNFPVIEISMQDKYEIGGLFYLWEFATAVMGYSLNINPFDEPNVSESKENTSNVLKHFEINKKLPEKSTLSEWKKIKLYAADKNKENHAKDKTKLEKYLKMFLKNIKAGDYISLMAYIQNSKKNNDSLQLIRNLLKNNLKAATTVGYGPRFLHSTGQLHKGGKDNGIFIQIVGEDKADVSIPDKPYSFGILKQAQAIGDFESLKRHNRRAIKIQIGKNTEKGLKNIQILLEKLFK